MRLVEDSAHRTVETLLRVAPLIPVIPAAASYRLGWRGLQAVR